MKKGKVILSFAAGEHIYNPGDEVTANDKTAEIWAKVGLIKLVDEPQPEEKKRAEKKGAR